MVKHNLEDQICLAELTTQKNPNNSYGPFTFNLNYKYTGKFVDWDGSANSKQKSTDLVDISLKRNWYGNVISLNLTNLLNERYEKPATYIKMEDVLEFS